MSDGSNQNWGGKGAALAKFFIAILLFIIMLIWIYKKNQHGLN